MIKLRNISIFHGIGRRLLLWFSLFFLIPLLTVSYTGYQQSKKAIRKQVYDHFESLLDLQQEALLSHLHQKEIQLTSSVAENDFLFITAVVLQSATFSKGDILTARERIQKYVTEKNQEIGAHSLWILGKEGRVIASSDPEMLGRDRSASPEFLAYQRGPLPSKTHYVETERGPGVLVFAPIKSVSGKFLSLVTLSINMEGLYRILENRTGLGESGETYLVNEAGYMISPSKSIKDAVLKNRVNLEAVRANEDWRTSETYPLNYGGHPVIQAHTEFPLYGWTLIGEMETSEAFHELTVQRNRTVLVVIVLFCLLVVTAAVISRNLTLPIRTLARAAKEVGKGDLNQRVNAKPGTELADLALEFNRMTEGLRESKKKMEDWNATIQQEVENRTQDLIKSELKFRNLMEKANDAIMIFDTESKRCTMANLKAEILTGYGQEELLKTHFFDFFPPDDRERTQEHYLETLKKGSANLYNISIQRKDKRLVYVDLSNSLIDFQNQTFLNCILHDVTEQRRMEREREAVFQLSEIIAKSSDLNQIIRKALENILQNLELEVAVIFLYNNKRNELQLACQKGFSETFVETFGRQIVTGDSKRVCVRTAFTGEMQYLQDPFEGEMKTFLHPDVVAEKLQTLVSLPLIAEETLVGVLQVITYRKKRFSGISLMLLEALANQLSAGILRIRLETDQREMQERIQQSEKLSSVGQLAAGIAHEIGTPLNIISGNAEYLMTDLGEKDPKTEELSVIIQQTERITKLIQQLMDFARDTQPSFEPTDVHQLIDNILTLTRHQFKRYNITLESDLNGAVPQIIADPNQLQQVFLNIMINAIHAMPNGGTFSTETSVDESAQTVQIRFRDTGCGIPKEQIKDIFNPFFTTKEVGQGTGLGLAVSHRIIESHQGSIDVESKINAGTCFTVILPIHAEES